MGIVSFQEEPFNETIFKTKFISTIILNPPNHIQLNNFRKLLSYECGFETKALYGNQVGTA